MSEEVPFRSIKITLSNEAIAKLGQLRFKGSFRSDSATVEECIRAIYDVALDIELEVERTVNGNQKWMPMNIQAETLRRIVRRMSRFITLTEETMKKLRSGEPSAGP